MARALIVGCGCRGRELGRELIEAGWQVRGTTRDPAKLAEIEAAGIEAMIADPDRIADVHWAPTVDQAERVHAALAALSLPHREVVTLRFLEQMPLDEIAVVTGAPVGTVKSRLHYAKRVLKTLLETGEDGHE